jgi:hypothetical protein
VGIPFLGEAGYYPPWALASHRAQWLFQRTLASVRGDIASELAARQVPSAEQVIVWVPQRRGLLGGTWFAMHEERTRARQQLSTMSFLCYEQECELEIRNVADIARLIKEEGIAPEPESWRLVCPRCSGLSGPNLTPVTADGVLARWYKVGRPELENPSAGLLWRSAAAVTDLDKWIQASNPSKLELAYLGQQMWPDISRMLNDCCLS